MAPLLQLLPVLPASLPPIASILLLSAALSLVAFAFATAFVSLVIPKVHPTLPPLPGTRWLFGNAQPLFKSFKETGQFHAHFAKIAVQNARRPFLFYWPGSLREPMLVVSDPLSVDQILTGRDFDRGPDARSLFATIAPLGSLALPAEKMWRRHRQRLLGPAMNLSTIRAVTPTLISSIHELLSLWELKRTLLASSTEPIAVDKDLSFLAVDIISQLAFGQSYELLSGTTALVREQGPRAPGQAFGRKMSEIGEASALIFESLPAESIYPALSRFVQKLTTPRVRRAEAQLFAFLDGNIVEGRRRVRGGESVDGLLGSILEKEREDEVKTGAELMAVQEIRDEMITFLVAGEETTSSTMMWMVRYLAAHPEVQRKMHEESLRVFPPEDELSFDSVAAADAHYIDATLAESLRLSHTIMIAYRVCSQDTVIGGHHIPAGTDVQTHLGLVGRTVAGPSEKPGPLTGWATDDTDSFRPERWLDGEGRFNPKAGPSNPYAIGPRGCYGMRLASLELKLFLVLLSRSFFLLPLPPHLADEDERKVHECVTRRPTEAWVRLERWGEGESAR